MRVLYRSEEGYLAVAEVIHAGYDADVEGLCLETAEEDELEFEGIDRAVCEALVLELYREGKLDLSIYKVTE